MVLKKEYGLMYTSIAEKRRSKMRIMADILGHAQKPAKKTHIMYECNLSFNQLRRYLNFLKERALIRRKNDNGPILYQTTDNGQEFLSKYSSTARLLRSHTTKRSDAPTTE